MDFKNDQIDAEINQENKESPSPTISLQMRIKGQWKRQ